MTLSRKFFLSRKIISTLYYCCFHLPGKNISNNCNFDNNNSNNNNNNKNNNNNNHRTNDDDDNERPMIVTIIIQP